MSDEVKTDRRVVRPGTPLLITVECNGAVRHVLVEAECDHRVLLAGMALFALVLWVGVGAPFFLSHLK